MEKPTLRLIEVRPIGVGRFAGFACRVSENDPSMCEGMMYLGLSYPESARGDALREARVEADLSMGQAARSVNISVVEWSSLEHGRLTLSDEQWTELLTYMEGARRS